MVYTLRFFSLQNAVCLIILTYLVPVLFTFYIQGVLKLEKIIRRQKVKGDDGCITSNFSPTRGQGIKKGCRNSCVSFARPPHPYTQSAMPDIQPLATLTLIVT